MKKTIQLGLRIDEELNKRIEKIAQLEDIDKMSWIRRALTTFLVGEEDGAKSEAITEYIHLIIDETELKKVLSVKEIPKDIQEARKEMLNRLKKKETR